jgi:hypothetical protein
MVDDIRPDNEKDARLATGFEARLCCASGFNRLARSVDSAVAAPRVD